MTAKRMVWQFIETRDHRVMRRVNRWRAPRWLRYLDDLVDPPGRRLDLVFDWDYLAAVRRRHALCRFCRSAAAEAATVALFRFMKNASKRKRPCQLEAHCWANILPPDQFSFPSGHAMSAFAIAIPLCIFYPQLQAALLALSLSIAVSRVILGMHFVSDVVVGSLLGRDWVRRVLAVPLS